MSQRVRYHAERVVRPEINSWRTHGRGDGAVDTDNDGWDDRIEAAAANVAKRASQHMWTFADGRLVRVRLEAQEES
jgi:hypothetical protein